MVVDRLENLEKYASLNPLFAKAMEYLKATDLNAQELGKVKLQASGLATFINDRVEEGPAPKARQILTPAVFASYKPFEKQ